MKDIVIVGASGFGREVLDLILQINSVKNEWNVVGFVDDSLEVGQVINNYKVIGNTEWLKDQELFVVIAIGDPLIKRIIANKLSDSKNRYPILIHPSVIKSDSVSIGEGSIITAACILTVNIAVGSHVILNLDCTIGHDVIIEDYVTVLPSVNVSGNVLLKECCSIGTGTAIIQGLQVGSSSVIGAGSTVVKDIPDSCVAVGSPAKPIRYFK